MIRAEKHSCVPPADERRAGCNQPQDGNGAQCSGIGSICEVASARSNVRFYFDGDRAADFAAVLKRATSGSNEVSFNHVVGGRKEGRRHLEAQSFRGLCVDDQLVFAGRLHRKLAGLCAS
jgi:hypothetical protein